MIEYDDTLNVDFIDFLSTDDKDSPAESDTNITTIGDIEQIMKTFIANYPRFNHLGLMVEIKEIRNYNGLIFLKVCDKTMSIKTLIPKGKYKTELKIGDKIFAQCYLELYRCELELIIVSYKKQGTGSDNLKLESLKQELTKLGYFGTKPDLKSNYVNIGVISSLNAAGLKDFIHIVNSRCTNRKIYIYPATVQGITAPNDISKAITLANHHNKSHILVLIRGGGSSTDLECFNTKQIAKSIFESKIPIVTGIGHQIDVSIADMTACKSFITPTAVAQNITTENVCTYSKVELLVNIIFQKIISWMNNQYDYIQHQEVKLLRRQSKFMTNLETLLTYHNDQVPRMRKNIQFKLNAFCNYILNIKTELSTILTTHHEFIEKFLNNYQDNLAIKVDQYGQSLNGYDICVKNMSKPYIVSNDTGKEITFRADLLKNKTYTICFLDGDYDLKIN
jgi:exodeoxyribonuclease VII large subunit